MKTIFAVAGIVWATVLRAAPVTPAAGAPPKIPVPSTPAPVAAQTLPAAKSSPDSPTVIAPEKNGDAGLPSAAAPAPLSAASPAANAPGRTKPGIFSAVKSKGPPPMGKGLAAPSPLSPRFQQVRTRIGALFDGRNSPPPPDPRTNPFRPAGVLPLVPLPPADGAESTPVAVNVDLTTLQQAVATIRVRGTVQRGKSMQLVITSAPGKEGTYKEGDVINVALPPGDPVHLRVRQILAHSVTLALNEAEMTLKF